MEPQSNKVDLSFFTVYIQRSQEQLAAMNASHHLHEQLVEERLARCASYLIEAKTMLRDLDDILQRFQGWKFTPLQ